MLAFPAPANASSELEFFRHRIHVERDSVRRAREALRQQKSAFQGRQRAWKQRSARTTLEQLVQVRLTITSNSLSIDKILKLFDRDKLTFCLSIIYRFPFLSSILSSRICYYYVTVQLCTKKNKLKIVTLHTLRATKPPHRRNVNSPTWR